jgi:hypothetical protein
LTDALDRPGTDLSAVLAVMLDDLRSGIPSFLGLRIAVVRPGGPVTLTTFEDSATIRSSVRIPFQPVAHGAARGTIEFFAGATGAFDRLAQDVRSTFGLDGDVVVDDLPSHPLTSGPDPTGLDTAAVVDQAVGVLIARGHDPDRARDELDRLAGQDGSSRRAAARRLLDDLGDAEGLDRPE